MNCNYSYNLTRARDGARHEKKGQVTDLQIKKLFDYWTQVMREYEIL